jgi:hypothetical protein
VATAVYLRVSTEEQRERQSIATQRAFGERYRELHDLAVYRVYADDGVSGTVPLSFGRKVARFSKTLGRLSGVNYFFGWTSTISPGRRQL